MVACLQQEPRRIFAVSLRIHLRFGVFQRVLVRDSSRCRIICGRRSKRSDFLRVTVRNPRLPLIGSLHISLRSAAVVLVSSICYRCFAPQADCLRVKALPSASALEHRKPMRNLTYYCPPNSLRSAPQVLQLANNAMSCMFWDISRCRRREGVICIKWSKSSTSSLLISNQVWI